MTSPFEAAIETLQEAINKCVLWEDGNECPACDARRSAIRVLEAAAKVDKERAIAALHEDQWWYEAGQKSDPFNEVEALLAALPDPPKEKP